ncbi:alpha/beta fold hydrolase [Nonomuraea candida]|uniref:alpha/beta fold hydrolase n=1 Tax=Nonomuraea candida TaxID=359159 RepID=UPI000A05ECA1|nr:alpha/beta fold hydrolase [Nonomuraea candida]
MFKPLALTLALLSAAAQPATATTTATTTATKPIASSTAPATAGSTIPTPPRESATAAPPEGPGAATLKWQPCPHDKIGMECADLQVPVNWQKPDGRKITLKLGRLKATGGAEAKPSRADAQGTPNPRKSTADPGGRPSPVKAAGDAGGSVLVAYGGPGGPGIAMTQSLPHWWAELRKTMDIVTWDTRGYGGEQFQGLSTGLPCAWTRIPIADFPEDDADFGRLSDTNRGYAEACRLKDPELFANMSSADHARDMEAIRQALGDDKLNYYGASYAGFYGQSYARLFPGRVRTMVLDGTLNHSTADWSRELEESARSNERSMRRFFTWCATNGCEDVPGLWRRLIAKADRTPIPTKTANVAYRTADLQSFALGLARQGVQGWPRLAQAIRKASRGDASDFVPSRGARYPDQATPVTECTDWPRFADHKELTAALSRLRKAAPDTGAANTLASATLGCIGWPVPVTNPPAALPKSLPPLLGAGAWGESEASERLLSQVPGSVTIHHDGPGHTLYGTNPCARDHINHYLTTGTLPPPKTHC